MLGTDFSPEMLEVARRKARGYAGRPRLSFQVEDAQSLSLPDASFDVVTVAFGVRNFPDRAANFREVLRVLQSRRPLRDPRVLAAAVRALPVAVSRHT